MIYIKVCYLLYNRHNVARISLMKQIYDLVQIEVTKAMAQSMGKARLQVSRSNFQKLSRGTTEPGSQTFSKAPAFSSECCRCGTKNERETKSKLSEGLASERWDSECRRKSACDAVTLHVHPQRLTSAEFSRRRWQILLQDKITCDIFQRSSELGSDEILGFFIDVAKLAPAL